MTWRWSIGENDDVISHDNQAIFTISFLLSLLFFFFYMKATCICWVVIFCYKLRVTWDWTFIEYRRNILSFYFLFSILSLLFFFAHIVCVSVLPFFFLETLAIVIIVIKSGREYITGIRACILAMAKGVTTRVQKEVSQLQRDIDSLRSEMANNDM